MDRRAGDVTSWQHARQQARPVPEAFELDDPIGGVSVGRGCIGGVSGFHGSSEERQCSDEVTKATMLASLKADMQSSPRQSVKRQELHFA